VDVSSSGRNVGAILASSHDDAEALAPWRSLTRFLARSAGEGDMEKGAEELLQRGARHPCVAGFRRGAGEVQRAAGGERVTEAVEALARHLSRELRGVLAEARMGRQSASRLRPTRQVAVSRMERPVQRALGGVLEGVQEPVHDDAAFGRLLARAFRLAGATPRDPGSRGASSPRAWSTLLRILSRLLGKVEAILIEMGFSLGEPTASPGAPAPAESPAHETSPPPAAPTDPASGIPSLPLRWLGRLHEAIIALLPHLTPKTRSPLLVPT